MSLFGPGWKPKPGWKQGWWWRERLSDRRWVLQKVLAVAFIVVLATVGAVGVWWMEHRNDPASAREGKTTATTPPAPAQPTTSVRPTEQPPKRPEAATKPDIAGIEATVRFEIDALNYAQRTGDFTPLKSVYNMNTCKSCQLVVQEFSKHLQDGETYVDREYVITSITADAMIGKRGQAVGKATVGTKQPKDARLLDKHGTEIERIPATPEAKASYELEYGSDGWTIQEVYAESKS